MWPAITDDPTAPGRGLPVYQPATAVLAGTCKVRALVSPRWTSLLLTPIAGITRRTGLATRAGRACRSEPGNCPAGPCGTTTGAGGTADLLTSPRLADRSGRVRSSWAPGPRPAGQDGEQAATGQQQPEHG